MRSLCCVGMTDDTTRVPLGVEGGYINASFIRMPVGNEEFVYIACQGPLPTTVADFWQMVWEQNCTVIAMMTQEVEGEKIKCQRYWPDVLNKTTMINDRLRLALVRLQQLKGFIIRVLELQEIQVSESNSACLEFFLSVVIFILTLLACLLSLTLSTSRGKPGLLLFAPWSLLGSCSSLQLVLLCDLYRREHLGQAVISLH